MKIKDIIEEIDDIAGMTFANTINEIRILSRRLKRLKITNANSKLIIENGIKKSADKGKYLKSHK